MEVQTLIALGGLMLHGIAVIATAIWQISKVRSDLMEALASHRKDVSASMDDDRRAINEIISNIRQKMNDVELAAYKTFVRRDSFHEIINRVSAENVAFKEEIGARLDRQESKIDKLIERGMNAREA